MCMFVRVCMSMDDNNTIIIQWYNKMGDVLISTHTNYLRKTKATKIIKTYSQDDNNNKNTL